MTSRILCLFFSCIYYACIFTIRSVKFFFSFIFSTDVNYEELSRCTDDFNGAQCKAVCVEAVRCEYMSLAFVFAEYFLTKTKVFLYCCTHSVDHFTVRGEIPASRLKDICFVSLLQGMIALRRGAVEVGHEDYMDGKNC